LDRISGALKLRGRAASFEIPENVDIGAAFSISTDLRTAQIFLRDGRGLNLRNRSRQIADPTTPVGWQKFDVDYRDHQRFVEELLWYSDDLIVSAPRELRDEIIGHLKSGMVRYG
jgi:proteasome accessory factor B